MIGRLCYGFILLLFHTLRRTLHSLRSKRLFQKQLYIEIVLERNHSLTNRWKIGGGRMGARDTYPSAAAPVLGTPELEPMLCALRTDTCSLPRAASGLTS